MDVYATRKPWPLFPEYDALVCAVCDTDPLVHVSKSLHEHPFKLLFSHILEGADNQRYSRGKLDLFSVKRGLLRFVVLPMQRVEVQRLTIRIGTNISATTW